jgi:hypothetical protein
MINPSLRDHVVVETILNSGCDGRNIDSLAVMPLQRFFSPATLLMSRPVK